MQKLLDGIHKFQQELFVDRSELFETLADGQHPQVLFVTCSDSRIDPNLLTQTEPGELFILRNAGNIIPPYGASNGGEGATVEFALEALNVEHIILCGHTHCGAIKGLLDPSSLDKLPLVKSWLSHATATQQIVKDYYAEKETQDSLLNIAIQENVLVQLENLRTYPLVASRIQQGNLHLHAWVYKFETGEVFAYNPEAKQFLPLASKTHQATSS